MSRVPIFRLRPSGEPDKDNTNLLMTRPLGVDREPPQGPMTRRTIYPYLSLGTVNTITVPIGFFIIMANIR